MKLTIGPNSMPELQALSAEERRQLWQQNYREVVWSRIGVLAFVLYAICVATAMVLADHFGTPHWVGIIAGNVTGSLLGQGIVAAVVQRRLVARKSTEA